MCDHDFPYGQIGVRSASLSKSFQANGRTFDEKSQSSRRQRLWELPSHTHCLLGVCLPLSMLRRLINKALGFNPIADDYDFHVSAVAECGRRKPISELLQRELDRRYASTLQRFAQAKTAEAVAMLWKDALKSSDVAGALWATFSHARCDENLREQVCRDIHMFQHRAGACNRADLQRLDQLQEENSALARELSIAKERHTQVLAQRATHVKHLEAELMRCPGAISWARFDISLATR